MLHLTKRAAASRVVAFAALWVLGVATVANGQTTRTWRGAGADNNWNTTSNWDGSNIFASGNAMVFAGATRTSPNNNLTNPSVAGITFAPGAAAFTLTGNSFALTGNLTNNSSSLQTINNAMTVSDMTVAGSGSVTFAGNVTKSGDWNLANNLAAGSVLTITGNLGIGSGSVFIPSGTGNSVITGSFATGFAIFQGRGTTTIAGNNNWAYTGYTGLTGGGRIVLDYDASNTSKLADGSGVYFGGTQYEVDPNLWTVGGPV